MRPILLLKFGQGTLRHLGLMRKACIWSQIMCQSFYQGKIVWKLFWIDSIKELIELKLIKNLKTLLFQLDMVHIKLIKSNELTGCNLLQHITLIILAKVTLICYSTLLKYKRNRSIILSNLCLRYKIKNRSSTYLQSYVYQLEYLVQSEMIGEQWKKLGKVQILHLKVEYKA